MTSATRSRVRRWGLAILLLLLLGGGPVVGLPWIVRIPAVHRALCACANSVLAPGSVEFAPLRLSWFRPTEVPGVTLRDAQGDTVLFAPELTWEWGLWQMLVSRPPISHLDLRGAQLDIERRPDGTIDLHETLRPVLPEFPPHQLLIHLEDSRVRLRDRLLGEPFLADDLDARLDMGRGHEPISWRISLTPKDTLGQSGRLELEGSYSRARVDSAGRHDMNLTITGAALPFAVAGAGQRIKCRGVLDGTIDAQLQSGVWLSKGESKLSRFELNAPALAVPIRLENVTAAWDVKGSESGLTVDRLALESSLGSLRAEGTVPAASTRDAWIEANLKLVDLRRRLPGVLRPREGSAREGGVARLRADLRSASDGLTQNCEVRCTISDLDGRAGERGVATDDPAEVDARRQANGDVILGAHASYNPRSDRLDLTELAAKFAYFQLDGAGSIGNLAGKPQLDLQGTLNPDWSALTALLAAKVEPDARIAGQPRSWRVSGSIASSTLNDALKSVSGELGFQVDALDVFGIRLGRSVLMVRAENGEFRIDPIDTTLNQGLLHVEPVLVRDEKDHVWMRLGESSTLKGAVINEEVSHRVLSYAAPILDGATRVRGRVSARLAQAEFPIVAPAASQARISGKVSFDDVRFIPGRLADQLLAVFDKQDQTLLVLRNTISIQIEDRKVHQKGLVIPVANLASIALDGSVDFDRNLDLVAALAMNRSASFAGILPPVLRNAQVNIPIRGTMQSPKIDTAGFRGRIADMGMDFIDNSVGAGLNGLKRFFGGKSVRGLGDSLVPRARPTTPAAPPDPENVNPSSKALRKTETLPGEPDPAAGGAGRDEDTDELRG